MEFGSVEDKTTDVAARGGLSASILAEGFASSFYSAIDFHTRRKLRKKKKEKYPVEFHTAAGNCFGKL